MGRHHQVGSTQPEPLALRSYCGVGAFRDFGLPSRLIAVTATQASNAIYQPPPRGPKTEAAAVTAFVLSITSFFIWFVPSIVAFVLASSAKRNIASSNGLRKGKGLAIAAQIVSVVAFAIALGICALIALVR